MSATYVTYVHSLDNKKKWELLNIRVPLVLFAPSPVLEFVRRERPEELWGITRYYLVKDKSRRYQIDTWMTWVLNENPFRSQFFVWIDSMIFQWKLDFIEEDDTFSYTSRPFCFLRTRYDPHSTSLPLEQRIRHVPCISCHYIQADQVHWRNMLRVRQMYPAISFPIFFEWYTETHVDQCDFYVGTKECVLSNVVRQRIAWEHISKMTMDASPVGFRVAKRVWKSVRQGDPNPKAPDEWVRKAQNRAREVVLSPK